MLPKTKVNGYTRPPSACNPNTTPLLGSHDPMSGSNLEHTHAKEFPHASPTATMNLMRCTRMTSGEGTKRPWVVLEVYHLGCEASGSIPYALPNDQGPQSQIQSTKVQQT